MVMSQAYVYEESTWRPVIGQRDREWVPVEFQGWKGEMNGSRVHQPTKSTKSQNNISVDTYQRTYERKNYAFVSMRSLNPCRWKND